MVLKKLFRWFTARAPTALSGERDVIITGTTPSIIVLVPTLPGTTHTHTHTSACAPFKGPQRQEPRWTFRRGPREWERLSFDGIKWIFFIVSACARQRWRAHIFPVSTKNAERGREEKHISLEREREGGGDLSLLWCAEFSGKFRATLRASPSFFLYAP